MNLHWRHSKPSQEEQFTFEAIFDFKKIFSISVGESENVSLKINVFLDGWISTAAKVLRHKKNIHGENLPGRFKDWMYKECGMKKQTMYNLYKVMRTAPKPMNCRVNMTYIVLNHDILFNYSTKKNEEQSLKHSVSCDCEGCNS